MVSAFRSHPARIFIPYLLAIVALLMVSCGGNEPSAQSPAQTSPAAPEPTPTAELPTFTGKPAVIYVVGPLSGENAQVGQAQAAGARVAADQLNRAGGLLGREIVVKSLNDHGEPEAALAAVNKIADAARAGEDVIGVVVHEGSDPGLEGAAQVYLNAQSGLDLLVVLPSSSALAPAAVDDQRLFRLSAPSLSQAREVAMVFQEQNLHGVVVVHTADSYGRKLADEFSKAVESLDIETIATFEIPSVTSFEILSEAVSYSETIAQINKLNPTALFFVAGPDESAVFLSELFGLEFQGSIIGSGKSLAYTVVDELGCQSEGIKFASVLPEPAAAMSPEHIAAYADLEGQTPGRYSVAGDSGVEFIVRSYLDSGVLEAGAAASHARQTATSTIIGDIAFDTSGQVLRPKIHFLQVQGRLFKESFAREVGAPAQANEESAKDSLTMLNLNFAPGKDPIVFAGLNWNSAQFANGIARVIIEAGYGYPTNSRYGASVPLFRNLESGQVHVYMEGWLPNLQVIYDNALAENQIEDIGLFFGDAVQGWFVPRYVVDGDADRGIEAAAPGLKSVSDLADHRRLFVSAERPGIGEFVDGSSGWGSYKINCTKLKTYRLDDKYAQITTGSGSALFERLSSAYENGEPVLVYMWEPTWPIARFDLVQLSEPEYAPEIWERNKGVAYPKSQIRKLVHRDLRQNAPELVEFLSKITLSPAEISQVLLAMKEQEQNPEEAAKSWLRQNEATWSSWVPGEVATKVKQTLEV